jgi:protein-L-isoaspartate(D-aspartate) O-methyltransferase
MATNLNSAHSNMIAQQVRPSDVLDVQVLRALQTVKREMFVDEAYIDLAYADTQLPIDYGQMMLSPVLEGRLLQTLKVQQQEQVFEIGTGSGYFTALLATLASHVWSVEIIPELSQRAQQNLDRIKLSNISLDIGDASQSWPLKDRVDVIVATAAFVTVPDDYLQALKVGGRMLAVVGTSPVMQVQVIHRITEWEWQIETAFETLIPPLINAEPKPEFKF